MNNKTPAHQFGQWGDDSFGLPTFSYHCLPSANCPDGLPVHDPIDPFFLIGNYRLTAFIHASGRLMLFSTDRALARLNPGATEAEGASSLHLEIEYSGGSDKVALTGPDSTYARAAETQFGCGFAAFNYTNLPAGLSLKRTVATAPSVDWKDGCPALLVELELTAGATPLHFAIVDTVDAAYDMGFWHNFPCRVRRASYPVVIETPGDGGVAVSFTPVEEMPLVLGDEPDDAAYADRFPAGLRYIPLTAKDTLTPVVEPLGKDAARVGLRVSGELAAYESRTIRYVLAIVRSEEEAQAAVRKLTSAAGEDASFRDAWSKKVPSFSHESDEELRRELRWHAYTLLAMATWSDYFQSVFIPQGTVYEYALGCAACLRDHMQHALPACHFDADLARAVLRFAVRKTNNHGRIQGEDEGAGLIPEGTDKKSDDQIYAMQLMAEYLLAQRDGAFLAEEVPFFDGGRTGTVLNRVERWFRFLRDVVGIGPHGHIRVLRSDWNDCFHEFFPDRTYGDLIWFGESLLNTTQAIVVMERLAQGLEASRPSVPSPDMQIRLDRLVAALRAFRAQLLPPLLALLETCDWCPRARINDEIFGDDQIILEPQGWTMLIPEVPVEKRRRMLDLVRAKLLDGERKGARVMERALPGFSFSGMRETGGIWLALNGPLAMAALELDPEFGNELVERMTLRRHVQEFPHSWPGTWTAPDCVNSSRATEPGGAEVYTRKFPGFCAHAHAWPLYLALRMRQNSPRP